MPHETPTIPQENLVDAWVTIRLNALRENARSVRRFLTSNGPRLMAVVKADGYGHGAVQAAKAFLEGGAQALAVTTLGEALELTGAGIDSRQTPILVFAPLVTREQADSAVAQGIHLTVCDAGHVELMRAAAQGQGAQAQLHLKVDTGMGRLGLSPPEALGVALKYPSDETSKWVGVYTHFARASEPDLMPTKRQLALFEKFCEDLQHRHATGLIRHCANSAGLVRLPESRMDMVRAGTILYGQAPSSSVPLPPGIDHDTWTLQARAVFVHDLAPGATVGYGAETRVARPTRAAVLPIGYADGFTLQPASVTSGKRGLNALLNAALGRNKLSVQFGGKRALVLGRVAMQMIVVDVTDIVPPVKVGDVATVPVRRLAASARLPRIYETGEPPE